MIISKKHGNSHCSQINEWKRLNFVFARNDRTKRLFNIIDRYESTAAAAVFQGGNDGDIVRTEMEQNSVVYLNSGGMHDAVIRLVDGQISGLRCTGLQDHDIVGLQYLPQNLRLLAFDEGTLTHFDLNELPPQLETLILKDNEITMMMVRSTPNSLTELDLGNNPLMEEGVILKLPLPEDLLLIVPATRSLNLGDAELQPDPLLEGCGLVTWPDGTSIKVRAVGVGYADMHIK